MTPEQEYAKELRRQSRRIHKQARTLEGLSKRRRAMAAKLVKEAKRYEQGEVLRGEIERVTAPELTTAEI
jgi:hypothetical protein